MSGLNVRSDNRLDLSTTPIQESVADKYLRIRVGCFNVNPGSRSGRRLYMCQMLVLAFIPHAALILQNCTIMAELAGAFDSSIYLNVEMNTTQQLGYAVSALQRERSAGTKLLYSDGGIWNFTESFGFSDAQLDVLPLAAATAELRAAIVEQAVSKPRSSLPVLESYAVLSQRLLTFVTGRVKSTMASTWKFRDDWSVTNSLNLNQYRTLTASYELLRGTEEFLSSVPLALEYFEFGALPMTELLLFAKRDGLMKDHLTAAWQFNLAGAEQCDELDAFHHLVLTSTRADARAARLYLEVVDTCSAALRFQQDALWENVSKSVKYEMWRARSTLAVGIVILVVVLLVSPVIILLVRNTVQTLQTFTRTLEISTQELTSEKMKSDKLLSRMLPISVLNQLRAERTVPAESFDSVTIFFSDIVGFTTISAKSTAMEVINMLNMLYRLFDDRIKRFNVYKVETIGDAYMVASGLPKRNGNRHASEIADMSLCLMAGLRGVSVPHRMTEQLYVRVGINTGSCVAGVVGTSMPRYCLFGDTINTASRMESTGEPMKIHLSATTKAALDDIGGYQVESRGLVDIPGKGNMETFWLTGKIGETYTEFDNSPCFDPQEFHFDFFEELLK